MKVSEELVEEVRNRLEDIIHVKVKVRLGGEPVFMPSSQYKCPVCTRTHQSDNLVLNWKLQLDCFSNRQRGGKAAQPFQILDAVEEFTKEHHNAEQLRAVLESVEAVDDNPFEHMDTQFVTQKYVGFDINRPTTYVVSSMGSGKSLALKGLLEQQTL